MLLLLWWSLLVQLLLEQCWRRGVEVRERQRWSDEQRVGHRQGQRLRAPCINTVSIGFSISGRGGRRGSVRR